MKKAQYILLIATVFFLSAFAISSCARLESQETTNMLAPLHWKFSYESYLEYINDLPIVTNITAYDGRGFVTKFILYDDIFPGQEKLFAEYWENPTTDNTYAYRIYVNTEYAQSEEREFSILIQITCSNQALDFDELCRYYRVQETVDNVADIVKPLLTHVSADSEDTILGKAVHINDADVIYHTYMLEDTEYLEIILNIDGINFCFSGEMENMFFCPALQEYLETESLAAAIKRLRAAISTCGTNVILPDDVDPDSIKADLSAFQNSVMG